MYKLQIDYNPGKKNVDKFYVQDLATPMSLLKI